MKSRLAACPSCARHVRLHEAACPFCHHALPPTFRDKPAPKPPARRMTRGALYAFGAGTLGTVALSAPVACSSSSSGGDTHENYNLDAAYGAPDGFYDRPDSADGGPLVDTGPFQADAAYGGPATDSGPPVDGAPEADTNEFNIDAAYGGPGFDAESPEDAEPEDADADAHEQ